MHQSPQLQGGQPGQQGDRLFNSVSRLGQGGVRRRPTLWLMLSILESPQQVWGPQWNALPQETGPGKQNGSWKFVYKGDNGERKLRAKSQR